MAVAGSDADVLKDAHRAALELLDRGDVEAATAQLRDALAAALDPEALNDLAVLRVRAGESDEARDLLQALMRLHPGFGPGAENLATLGPVATPAAAVGTGAEVAADGARVRFLQVIAESLATRLVDNIDYLFEPWGRELPDPSQAGERIAGQLAILDGCRTLWRTLGDEPSRALLLRFLAYRALGPAHVRLQLEPIEYRRGVIGLTARALREACAVQFDGIPLEWQLHRYDLTDLGLPIKVIGSPLPLASTMVFSQYAYRDADVAARPRPGDTALDVGGCWGDTALWLAHVVGPGGQVHTFEPSLGNRQLLTRNLELNPDLAARIRVWDDPLAPRAGETVWLPDIIGAGATMQTGAPREAAGALLELRTQSVDALVEAGAVERVDFLKVDVEGADRGVLEGAAESIARFRPRIAIACYHKPDDLVQIPDLLDSLGVSYRWYLQCSTMTDVDTVAFGVPAE
jgi:FkbM family methyltransferase